jgi:hypothetical protein
MSRILLVRGSAFCICSLFADCWKGLEKLFLFSVKEKWRSFIFSYRIDRYRDEHLCMLEENEIVLPSLRQGA